MTGGAAKVRMHLERLARLQGELARRKARKAAAGGGVVLAGVALLALAIPTGLAAAAAGLATALDTWLAILIVFGAVFVLGGGLVAAGVAMLKRADFSTSENGAKAPVTPLGAGEDAEPQRAN